MYLRIWVPARLPTSEKGKLPESKETPFSVSSMRMRPLAPAPSATIFFTRRGTVGSLSRHATIFPATFSASSEPG